MADGTSTHAFITANRVEGTPVFNLAGDRIGHVEDLSIDKVSGKVVFVLMSFGGFLGIGERYHPLPWAVLKYDTGKDGYVIPLDRTQLEGAPAYSRDELAGFGAGDRQALFDYYTPYGAPFI